MNERYSKPPSDEIPEAEPFDASEVDFSEFEPNVSLEELQETAKGITDLTTFPFVLPIETLSVTKTIGVGRTNLTLIRPNVVQADAAVPRASFDIRNTPTRNPAVQMHFEPSAYGITVVSSYVMEFTVGVVDQSTFRLQGLGGSNMSVAIGPVVLSGPTTVRLRLPNVSPSQQVFGFLEQTAGGRWNWFSTQIRFPPLVIAP